jgi:L-asparaginase II
VQQQWVTSGYHRAPHPMQQRVLSTLAQWMRIDAGELSQGVDGCGLPTFAIALDAVALGCAKFAEAVHRGDTAPAAIFDAMVTHPEYVAGTDRLDTALMRAAGRRVVTKVGAEGYYCAIVPSQKIGVALKVEDGSKRAAEPAIVAALAHIEAIHAEELSALTSFTRPEILNTRNEVVGYLRTTLELGH